MKSAQKVIVDFVKDELLKEVGQKSTQIGFINE